MKDTQPDLAVMIMAGGAGTRFWPLSTEARPKQFLDLFGERSLLQMSHDRVAPLVAPERVLVLTNHRFVELVREQLPELPPENIIGEPLRRDTAAAVALGALICRERYGDPVMTVLTADHLIQPASLFQRTLLSAARAAASGAALYTFGVEPSYPATGFGYLQRGEQVLVDDGISHYELLRFREKPDLERAQRYVQSGEYLWNSGMFVWRTGAILDRIARHLPEHVRSLEPVVAGLARGCCDDQRLREAFEQLEPISIDFGVMEKAGEVRCVASSFEWNDVGGWLALREFLHDDGHGNRHRARLQTRGAEGNIVFAEDPNEVVALVGVRGLVVVRSGSRTLVVHRDAAEELKQLVQQLDPELR